MKYSYDKNEIPSADLTVLKSLIDLGVDLRGLKIIFRENFMYSIYRTITIDSSSKGVCGCYVIDSIKFYFVFERCDGCMRKYRPYRDQGKYPIIVKIVSWT